MDLLDIFTLGQSALVGSQTTLGEFVNALVCGTSSRNDHITNAAFIRSQSSDFAGNCSAHLCSLSEGL